MVLITLILAVPVSAGPIVYINGLGPVDVDTLFKTPNAGDTARIAGTNFFGWFWALI
jgi:hypothetical protein